MNVDMSQMDVPVVVAEFIIFGVNQVPGYGGINPAICVTHSVGHLAGPVVRNYANNNVQDVSAVRGAVHKALDMGRFGGRESCWCRVNCSVFTGSKEYLSCLIFVVKFFVKREDTFDKLVAGCGFSDRLEDIW